MQEGVGDSYNLAMRAIAYARVSQDDGTSKSPDQQLEACRTYADAQGWTIVAEHTDRDISGWSKGTKRPGLNAVLQAVERGEVDVLVVFALDRLTRQGITGLGRILTTLEAHNVELRSTTEDLSNEVVLSVYAAMAKLESEVKSNRVRRALDHHAAEGRPPSTARRVFGYTDNKFSAIDEREAVWVRRVVSGLLDDGDSIGRWARTLNGAGITSSEGNPWTTRTLSAYIKRPTIAGYRTYQGRRYEGVWPALISKEQHARLNTLQPKINRRALVNPFIGVMRCHCGAKMHVIPHHSQEYLYTCTASRTVGTKYPPHDPAPNGKVSRTCSISKYIVDDILTDGITAMLEGLVDTRAEHIGNAHEALEASERALEALESRAKQLSADYYQKGLLSAEIFDSTITAIVEERTRLETQIDRQRIAATRQQVQERLDGLVSWYSMTYDERKELAHLWISSVTILPLQGLGRANNPRDRIIVDWSPAIQTLP